MNKTYPIHTVDLSLEAVRFEAKSVDALMQKRSFAPLRQLAISQLGDECVDLKAIAGNKDVIGLLTELIKGNPEESLVASRLTTELVANVLYDSLCNEVDVACEFRVGRYIDLDSCLVNGVEIADVLTEADRAMLEMACEEHLMEGSPE